MSHNNRPTAIFRMGASHWDLTISDPEHGTIKVEMGDLSREERGAVRREAGRIFGRAR